MTSKVHNTRVPTEIETALARLEVWLETMRGPGGYGGPVAHWWQQSLMYTGPGLDWRYEGIIAGYLILWKRTGEQRWLDKARRAGDDLVAGQLENHHFAASAFENNPATAGTPHEACCDVGLLLLAQTLRQASDDTWATYAACAERNLRAFYIGQLWDEATCSFRDSPIGQSFVPNKVATACEAFFLLSEIRGEEPWVECYALPALDRIIAHQVHDGSQFDGAIAQNSFGSRVIEKYFPIYIARCVPALLRGYRWTNDARYVDSALKAMNFVARWAYSDGSLPTVVYADGNVNRYPSWIAALGDVLRAGEMLRPYGYDADQQATRERLLAGQDASGGVQTATGFAAQVGGTLSELPDVRDVLHVTGWCDKAFRYLALQVEGDLLPPERCTRFEATCTLRDEQLYLKETCDTLEISADGERRYRWYKGESWPATARSEFWLR